MMRCRPNPSAGAVVRRNGPDQQPYVSLPTQTCTVFQPCTGFIGSLAANAAHAARRVGPIVVYQKLSIILCVYEYKPLSTEKIAILGRVLGPPARHRRAAALAHDWVAAVAQQKTHRTTRGAAALLTEQPWWLGSRTSPPLHKGPGAGSSREKL